MAVIKDSIVKLNRSFFNIQIITCVGEGFPINYLFGIYDDIRRKPSGGNNINLEEHQ